MPAYPWSYSKLKAFETCPKQYYHLKVLKDFKEPQTEALIYGNEFHKAAEDFLHPLKPKKLPKIYDFAKATLHQMRAIEGELHPEQKLGLTDDMRPCGFWDDEVWYRGIADLVIEDGELAHVFDHKTGKNTKYADEGQLELMALSVFAHYPEVVRIKSALVFYVPRELIRRDYTRDDIEELWANWNKRYDRLDVAHDEGVFNAKPSGLCRRHCIVTSCPHNGRGT